MAENDDLLNLEQSSKKNLKKPLIYGAIAFLVFIIGVIIFAIYSNTSNEDKNVVLPPEEKEEKVTNFKEIPIEENDSLVIKKLIDNENTQNIEENKEKDTSKKEQNLTQKDEIKTVKVKEKPVVKENIKTSKKETKKVIKNYYIQVGALIKYKKPNKKFLELIKKEGYNYKLYEINYTKNDKKVEVIKILIGPFTKEEAKKELFKIKRKISKNAFIYRIK